MAPHTNTRYFKLFVIIVLSYLLFFFGLTNYSFELAQQGDSDTYFLIFTVLCFLLIGTGSLLWDKLLTRKPGMSDQIVIYVFAPIVLSVLMVLLYVVVVMIPVYSLSDHSSL